ncbi:hypothetical protein CMI47_00905 [Candidatus Pacearchaeota archaeon]|nr:hypothetical protein [Candidatus Pacearchaeota archaeon]
MPKCPVMGRLLSRGPPGKGAISPTHGRKLSAVVAAAVPSRDGTHQKYLPIKFAKQPATGKNLLTWKLHSSILTDNQGPSKNRTYK